MQARAFTERCVLNREVRVLLHSADSGARAVGEVVHVATGTPGEDFLLFWFFGIAFVGCGLSERWCTWLQARQVRFSFVLFVVVFCLRAQRWCAWPQARQVRIYFVLFLVFNFGFWDAGCWRGGACGHRHAR